MQVRIGIKTFTVSSFADASSVYRDWIEARRLGASKTPTAYIMEDGKDVAEISYNGKVWPLGTIKALRPTCDAPLYTPYGGQQSATY